MIKQLVWITIITLANFIAAGCSAVEPKLISDSNLSPSTGIINFGDPNVKKLITQLNRLEHKNATNVVTITQFGDSHTAADFFTGELRILMQAKYGNAGLGWVTPMQVPGQYHTAVSWASKYWQLFSSRTINDMDFPMGGYSAKPSRDGASIEVTPNIIEDVWRVKLTFKPLKKSSQLLSLYDTNDHKVAFNYSPTVNKWQSASITIKSPFTIKGNKEVELGSIWLARYKQSGVIVSTIGTNGARQSIWQKWNPEWFRELTATKSNLVMLEYGTNESLDTALDLDDYRQNLQSNIRQIRKALPNAVVLLISPPDTLVSSVQNASCDERLPPAYQQIKAIQRQVARSEGTLFWDWQQAMGGACIIEKWQMMGFARTDFVHQTRLGYMESARMFYADLIEFINK